MRLSTTPWSELQITTKPIRLFVGTDPAQHIAERALEASIRKNTSMPVDITWMRRGDPGWDWGGHREPEEGNLWGRWATPFSLFRWAVPEACGYEGRAIYLDCDMIVLGDLRELWEWAIPVEKACASALKEDVLVFECCRASRLPMVPMDGAHRQYARHHCVRLPRCWNDRDKLHDDTKLLHFTRLATQFWKPYKGAFPYDEPHPDPKAEALFWEYAQCQPSIS